MTESSRPNPVEQPVMNHTGLSGMGSLASFWDVEPTMAQPGRETQSAPACVGLEGRQTARR
jgi:hypothetical protein